MFNHKRQTAMKTTKLNLEELQVIEGGNLTIGTFNIARRYYIVSKCDKVAELLGGAMGLGWKSLAADLSAIYNVYCE